MYWPRGIDLLPVVFHDVVITCVLTQLVGMACNERGDASVEPVISFSAYVLLCSLMLVHRPVVDFSLLYCRSLSGFLLCHHMCVGFLNAL